MADIKIKNKNNEDIVYQNVNEVQIPRADDSGNESFFNVNSVEKLKLSFTIGENGVITDISADDGISISDVSQISEVLTFVINTTKPFSMIYICSNDLTLSGEVGYRFLWGRVIAIGNDIYKTGQRSNAGGSTTVDLLEPTQFTFIDSYSVQYGGSYTGSNYGFKVGETINIEAYISKLPF